MSQDQEFFSFDEALDRLHLKEEELKRLVSEGEIRAFRDGETMRLRRRDVDELRTELMGGDVVDLGGVEDIAFEDETGDFDQPGMATEELSAADTLLDEELEVLELEPEPLEPEPLDSDPFEEDDLEPEPVGATAEDDDFSPLALTLVFATTLVLLLTLPVLISLGSGHASDLAKGVGGIFVPFDDAGAETASAPDSIDDAEASE